MELFYDAVNFIKEVLIDFLQVIPVVFSFPVVILIIAFLFKDSIASLINSFAQYFHLKSTVLTQTKVAEMHRPAAPHQQGHSTQVHQSLAQAYAIKGSYDDAISQYKAAIKADPENVSAYIGLGNAFYKKGLHNDAIKALEKAVEIKPYWADCRCNLGAAYSLAGIHDKAVEEFYQAININPNYAAAHYGLGIAFISAGKFDKASEQVEVLKELDSNFAARLKQSVEESQKNTKETVESQG